jgi:hypothetical protein
MRTKKGLRLIQVSSFTWDAVLRGITRLSFQIGSTEVDGRLRRQ